MIYRILRAIVKPIFCLLYRVKIDGAENGKIDGRTMVIANHKSNCDPILMHLLFKPKIRLMAKKELFKNRFFGAVLRAFGAFPVSRGESDAAAVSNAMKMVADGELVGIFPEGTRIIGDALGKFQPGVAMMAMRSKAAIIPVYIDRKLKLFRRTHVTIGTPIDLSARVDKTSKIHDRIKQGTEILESEMQYLQERTANK